MRLRPANLSTYRGYKKRAAIMTVPMIIFILPALFIVLIGPGILQIIDGLSGV